MPAHPRWSDFTYAAVFFALHAILYWPTREAGFTTDFTGLMERLDGSSFSGIWTSFGFPSVQPVLNFCLFSLYRAFEPPSIGWALFQWVLHGINALLLVFFIKKWAATAAFPIRNSTPWLAGLIFLVLPYNSEVLVWRVCQNYLLSTMFSWFVLHALLLWIKNGTRSSLLFGHLALLGGLCCLELTYAILAISWLAMLFLPPTAIPRWRRIIAHWIVPQLVITGLYLFLTRMLTGQWVGHYGAEVHLDFPLLETLGKGPAYLLKYLAFSRYWDYADHKAALQVLRSWWGIIPLVAAAASLFVWRLRSPRTSTGRNGLTAFGFLAFFVALLPAISLYYNHLLHIENDRYGYLAGAFWTLFLVVLLDRLQPWLRYFLLGIYLIFAIYFTYQTNRWWAESAKVYWALLDSFPNQGQSHTFVLNLPDNVQGAVLFRDYTRKSKGLPDALKYLTDVDYSGHIHEVCQYNLTNAENSVTTEWKGDSTLQVAFRQYGNWWWRHGLGATDYENEWYEVSIQGGRYVLNWKKLPPNSLILYQDGTQWQTVPHEIN